MCGIVGLLIKSKSMRPSLGRLVKPMVTCMAQRGPDSGGVAVFGPPVEPPQRRFNLFIADHDYDWEAFLRSFVKSFADQRGDGANIYIRSNHAVLVTSVQRVALVSWLNTRRPAPYLLSVGRSMDLYKDIGDPVQITDRYALAELAGSHCIGHTRMATESEVTPVHAHPFTAGEDFCLVHNGSLSNPYMLRRMLENQGVRFETDNDSEAACRFIEWRLRDGDTLEEALQRAFQKLDGFYTLLMATADEMTLVRDAFSCKPAVVAETGEYVAIASEYRSLAHLPGVAEANLFEPQPEEIYRWQVS